MALDLTTDFGKRVARRLDAESTIWFTTVGAKGTPQTRPVWFLWDGQTILIYTRSEGRKLAHLAHSPRVSLNFDSDGRGGDIVVFTGEAAVDAAAPAPQNNEAYLAKYAAGIERIGMNRERFGKEYHVAIRVRGLRVRGH